MGVVKKLGRAAPVPLPGSVSAALSHSAAAPASLPICVDLPICTQAGHLSPLLTARAGAGLRKLAGAALGWQESVQSSGIPIYLVEGAGGLKPELIYAREIPLRPV